MAADGSQPAKSKSPCTARITHGASTHARRAAYPERIQLRVPGGFAAATEAYANEHGWAHHEFIRRVLVDGLRARGIVLTIGSAR